MGAYKRTHLLAPWQPEKHPRQRPSEGTLATNINGGIFRAYQPYTLVGLLVRGLVLYPLAVPHFDNQLYFSG